MKTLTSELPPPKIGEYDVIIPNLDDCGQFYIRETAKGGMAEFVDYERLADGRQNPAEICQVFGNKGDVILAVDGISTKHKTFDKVVAMIQRSTLNKYMFLRLGDPYFVIKKHEDALFLSTKNLQAKEDTENQISFLEKTLESKEEQVMNLKEELALRREELLSLDTESAGLSTWRTKKRIRKSAPPSTATHRSRRLQKRRNNRVVSPNDNVESDSPLVKECSP
mmetsp:Transcript_14003/g.18253  ORF Transcript_14003/g.18253 Transcript_14003/m.18253 type:complete len:224 (-) Transcript_14003:141-812(-)